VADSAGSITGAMEYWNTFIPDIVGFHFPGMSDKAYIIEQQCARAPALALPAISPPGMAAVAPASPADASR
jgi:hypothetical protein